MDYKEFSCPEKNRDYTGLEQLKGKQIITELQFWGEFLFKNAMVAVIINITKNKPELHCKHRPSLGHDRVKNDLYPEIGGG